MNTLFPIRCGQALSVLLVWTMPLGFAFSQDLMQVGDQWTGKLTQEGVIPAKSVPAEIEAVFVVTEREGKKFKARLEETAGILKVTYAVAGEIKRSQKDGKVNLSFKTIEVVSTFPPNTAAFTKVEFAGRVTMVAMSGKWKHPENDKGIVLGGTFDFSYKTRVTKKKPDKIR